ncbi:TatD family deoxyribonuclease [Baekduia soli]|uniref:TatD family deoxyribonuclease n=1 Tax=Baekduia soli TaxID=496014 RepID=A0A5B8U4H3_9ACTN|nr:TatD family hydrolase [Baekduia soli]QEC47562.1 TatD family deoxyribonuclease [Baekduia soli]
MAPRIVDAHCHLDAFSDDELIGVLADARAAGVVLLITVGMDVATSRRGTGIAAAHEPVLAAVGLHPWNAQDFPDGAPVAELEALAGADDVVAVGEIGLDFVDNSWLGLSYADPALRARQERVFRDQLQMARRLGLPVILHSRGAHATTTRVLAEEGMEEVGGCVQFFEGTPADVEAYAALGFGFSVGSSVTFPGAAGAWHETVRAIPPELLLVESDAPWLPYHGHASTRSAPADLIAIGAAIARVRGVEPEALLGAATANVDRVLRTVRTPA